MTLDPSRPLRSACRELFCQYLLRGYSPAQAYRKAGFAAAHRRNAWKLGQSPDVRARLAWLQAESARRPANAMRPLANAGHERFAQALARGKSATEAYERAGFSRRWGNAKKVRDRADVAARVEFLLWRKAERAIAARPLGLIPSTETTLRRPHSDVGALAGVEDRRDANGRSRRRARRVRP